MRGWRRAVVMCCALCVLTAAAPARAALSERSFSEDMASWGEALGEGIKRFGEGIKEFSADPEGYIERSGIVERARERAEAAGEAFSEYWPTFKQSVKGSVQAILDSDLSWEEKKERLKEYGELAIPYLAEIDFEAMGEKGRAALEALSELLDMDSEQAKAWIERNKRWLEDLKAYLES